MNKTPSKAVTKITAYTGMSIVIANMIGTGAFTSLGFQLESLNNTATILTLWVLGGILAISGAFSYAEVGTMIKRSGGEYAFLSQIFHPLVGYLSGWISLTAGFAAPIALSAIAFTQYLPIQTDYPKVVGVMLVTAITFIHYGNLNFGSKFQNISTAFKVLLILSIIVLGLIIPSDFGNCLSIGQGYFNEITSSAFGVSLIYVSYSYSGWNAAAYITEEFKNPRKALPIALIGGTLIVTVLYTLLQSVFLLQVPAAQLTGRLNVGTIAMQYMLGGNAAKLFGTAISLLLISGISAMIWVGPRVTASIANDFSLWKYFGKKHNNIPRRALLLQWGISTLLLVTGTFEQIMIYCGTLLTISSLLVVIGLFVLRNRYKENISCGYRAPLFPLFQIIYILLSFWMVVFAFINSTTETLLGMLNLLIGLGTYWVSVRHHNS